MKFFVSASVAALFAVNMAPVQAQTANTDNSLPESMRIQQSVTEQNARDPRLSRTRTPEVPSRANGTPGAVSPSENNRLDPSAPSPQRLQIDGNAGTRGTPGSGALNPDSTGTAAPSVPSNTGTGAGTAGASGVSTPPGIGNSGAGTSGAPRTGTAGSRAGSGSRGSSSGGSR